MAFSPVEASKTITEKYCRYLKTSFKISEPYKKEFDRIIGDGKAFAKGPYLDVSDAFAKGKSIYELIEEGVLPKSFSRIAINQTRPLYLHQEKAIRKVAEENRNIVVSTGTGSGKTESFLIPILRELVMEAENRTLTPGVRALLIYPMNALANDQTERLRELLADYPEITFGVYTGQTAYKHAAALAEYKELNNGATPLVNELISREQMIETPPHILITNYAMLEYLMLRPRDSVFFDGPMSKHWKFIIFDEAHVYNGSTGIEVSMLFRRLKAKLGNQKIKYILTSATLGEKENDTEVAEFAQSLCNAPFSKDDIVRAERIAPVAPPNVKRLSVSFYENMAEMIEKNYSDRQILQDLGYQANENLSAILYEIISGDSNYWDIRGLLSTPTTVSIIASELGWTEEQLSAFVSVASLAEVNGAKLFDARYHMFLRATESVFVTLAPDNHILLQRANYHYNGDTAYKVFEVATCSYCSAIYLVGKVENDILEQYNRSDELNTKQIFLLGKEVFDTDDDHSFESEGIQTEAYKLCPYCGFIKKERHDTHCQHSSADYITVYRVNLSSASGELTKCLHCENVNNGGVLRMFFSGQEAATSVIGTALFESLPSYEITLEETDDEDEFGLESKAGYVERKKRIAKQFIAFSDSRQAAAFYASYLNISYNNILYKRLIVEALKHISYDKKITVPEFVDRLRNEFERYQVKGKNSSMEFSGYSTEKEAWKAILTELVDNNGNNSLRQFGLMGISLAVEGSYKRYNLDEVEFKTLCSVFALSMLSDAAISYNAPLNDNDIEDFTHNGAMYSYTLSDSTGYRNKCFIPTRSGKSNKRIDYLQRVVAKKGITLSNDEAADFLTKLWNNVLTPKNYLTYVGNASFRINVEKVEVSKPSQWYICNKCRRITSHNIGDVCISYQCDGELIPVNLDDVFEDNHYYKLYNEMAIQDLRVVEHTAQLGREKAYDYQKKFKQKEIDVLSCSTTFEMGVDVGSLETVFMRNMPPHPSNYAQRAGRAGRSKQSAAFALTFCNKSSHDFSYFIDPTKMIKGKINPPKYNIENDRIAIRHLYSAALSYFWKLNPQYFCEIEGFLKKDGNGKSGYDYFVEYVSSKPEDLKQYLIEFLPSELSKKFKVNSFGWVEGLAGEDGILTEAIEVFEYEVTLLNELKDQLYHQDKYIGGVQQRIKAYNSENILAFLSRKNVLPKYGFPVDTVEMTVIDNKNGIGSGLQLQRDLSMAISEYAPGSEIVANNNLITSRYIKKVPSIGWKMYNYIQCDECKTLNIKPYTDDEDDTSAITECFKCHKEFDFDAKTFLIPAQGFVADGDKIRKPGLKKPERTYRGEISYVGFKNDAEEVSYPIGNVQVEIISSQNDEMAVLNTSPFYVCESCGYAEVDEQHYTKSKSKKHKNSSGYPCNNQKLKRFSLGYRFLTDVIRVRFVDYPIDDFEQGLSIMNGLLRGICTYLNIEENDISGCLQSNPENGHFNYSIVFFDNTPGGSGHVKQLKNQKALENVLKHTLQLMKQCDCGGTEGDTSCYSCLRNYKNQKYHDSLKRKYVIDFLNGVFN